TRAGESFLGVANFEDTITISFSFAQPFQRWSNLWENWNREACGCFVPKRDDVASSKIDIRTFDGTSLRLSYTSEAKKFQKIGTVLRIRIKPLCSHISNDGFELLVTGS